MPLYQLLGGASPGRAAGLRARLRARRAASCSTRSAHHLEQGFRAIRMQTGMPGLRRSTASPTARPAGERAATTTRPARRAAARRWRRTGTPAPTCATCPSVFEAVRNEFGPELPLLHDGHHRMTPDPGGAARAGTWSRTTCSGWRTAHPAENQEALRLVRQHTTTPLAIGEVFNTVWDYQTLHEGAADRLRPLPGDPYRRHHGACADPRLRCGVPDQVRACTGRPTSRRSAWPRRCTSDLAIHNFGIQEYMPHTPRDRRGVPHVATRSPTACCTRASDPGWGCLRRRGGRTATRTAGLPAGQPARGRHRARLVRPAIEAPGGDPRGPDPCSGRGRPPHRELSG